MIEKPYSPDPVVVSGNLHDSRRQHAAAAARNTGPILEVLRGLLPASGWLAKTTGRGEPRNAVLVTAILSFGCLLLRDLNAIAPLVTMFFLITYMVINVVLLIESSRTRDRGSPIFEMDDIKLLECLCNKGSGWLTDNFSTVMLP